MKSVTHLEKVITGEAPAVTHLERVIAEETAAVTYTEKVITSEAPPITHLQKVIAGEADPVTHLEYVWAGGSPPTEYEYTGAVPVTFTANGTPLIDLLISGNEEHSGTPTPDNPIIPEGCGDLETSGTKAGQYKIPISSANTTTPVYLGEVETTRRVKKLVLTGKETGWQLYNRITSVGGKYFNLPIATQERTEFGKMLCSHYTVGNPYDRSTACCVAVNYSRGIDVRVNNPSTDGNITDFKAYLQQQYAAGTPVTVWYVLATPETAVVNEPLMRIGDYADTLSYAQAGVEIPTARGTNTLDVLTDVKPSEVYIECIS